MTRATIQVPRPCGEDWAQMTPTAQGRYCAACQHTVTDFTQRTDAEILALLRQAAGGRVCGRFRAEQLSRELVHAPAAAPRWRAWLLTAAALWGVPAAAQGLRSTHSGGPMPAGGNAPVPTEQRPVGIAATKLSAATDSDPGANKPGSEILVRRITGRVLDDSTHIGIPGATVHVKGALIGTTTNSDGSFVLEAQLPADMVLVFSSIGYNRREMPLEELPQAQNLADVVMTIESWSPEDMVTIVAGGVQVSYAWYSPRGLWYRLRSLPRRLTGR